MIYCDETHELLPNAHDLGYEQQTDDIEVDYGVLFLRALLEAILKVPGEYFKCSNANRAVAEQIVEQIFHNSKKSPIKMAAFTHGERAFCYELYHQLRISLGEFQEYTPEDRKLVLHGELQKRVLEPLTEEHFRIQQLTKEYIPDFLLHVPKNCDNQEVVMEVKSSPKLQFNHIFADLKKLNEFIGAYHYNMGVFLAINVREEYLTSKLIKNEARLRDTIKYSDRIHIIVCKSPDEKVFQALLSDILK